MPQFSIALMLYTQIVKPAHKAVKEYYRALEAYASQNVEHELAVRSAFQNLLDVTGRKAGWTLIPELGIRGTKGRTVYPDGTFRDDYSFIRGSWEPQRPAMCGWWWALRTVRITASRIWASTTIRGRSERFAFGRSR